MIDQFATCTTVCLGPRQHSLADREQGVKVVESVFPDLVEAPRSPQTPAVLGAAKRVVEHRGRSAIVLAANVDALVALARGAAGVIAFVPRVGDFVATGKPLYRLYGNAARSTIVNCALKWHSARSAR